MTLRPCVSALSSIAVALLFVSSADAGASPATSFTPRPNIEFVADGCGYGFHRTASGRCDNVRDYNAMCQRGLHKVPTPSTPSGFRCVQNGY